MPDDAIERARNAVIAAQLSDAVIYNRDHAFRALAFKNRHLIVASLNAFAQQAPKGWRLVPIVPTREMKVAGGLAFNPDTDVTVVTSFEAGQAYTAMLDAAPSVTLGEVG
jgi:hypothetical protein